VVWVKDLNRWNNWMPGFCCDDTFFRQSEDESADPRKMRELRKLI
jgi:hypothetical protein